MKPAFHIPKPCTQDHKTMTPAEKGWFCNACAKNVVDFTGFSRKSLTEYMEAHPKTCGRVPLTLLDPAPLPSSRKKYLLKGILGALLALYSPVITAQVPVETTQTPSSPTSQAFGENLNTKTEKKQVSLTGIVKDPEDIPLPHALVTLEGSDINTFTDFDGRFTLTVPDSLLFQHSVLRINYVGLETVQVKVKDFTKPVSVVMDYEGLLGEIIIIKRPFWHRVKGWFRKK